MRKSLHIVETSMGSNALTPIGEGLNITRNSNTHINEYFKDNKQKKDFAKLIKFIFTNVEYSFLRSIRVEEDKVALIDMAKILESIFEYFFTKSNLPFFTGTIFIENYFIDIRIYANVLNGKYVPNSANIEIMDSPSYVIKLPKGLTSLPTAKIEQDWIEPDIYMGKEVKQFAMYNKFIQDSGKYNNNDLVDMYGLPNFLFLSKWLLACKNDLFDFVKLDLAYPEECRTFLKLLHKYEGKMGRSIIGMGIESNEVAFNVRLANNFKGNSEQQMIKATAFRPDIQLMTILFTSKFILPS